jgi:phage major head subunit gpT-like protein
MGASKLGVKGVKGEFYHRLKEGPVDWVNRITQLFLSDSAVETYTNLGMAGVLSEWKNGRDIKEFDEQTLTVKNLVYESTMAILIDELRRDKTGQIMIRIADQAKRANAHWAKILTTQIESGESVATHDGQFYFDTDHVRSDSGSQSNDVTASATSTTAPTASEMETAIMASIAQILGLKDDVGEPMNEDARSFTVMTPWSMFSAAKAAVGAPVIVDGSASRTNLIVNLDGFTISVVANPRLTWTTKIATFRDDADIPALIRQEEQPVTIDFKDEEFDKRRHLYGITAIRAVAFGAWQNSCLTTFT